MINRVSVDIYADHTPGEVPALLGGSPRVLVGTTRPQTSQLLSAIERERARSEVLIA